MKLPLAILPLLLAACGEGGAPPGAVVWNGAAGGDCEVLFGGARTARRHALTRWFGAESPAGADAPRILADTRDALVVTTPSRVLVALPPSDDPLHLQAGVRRPAGEGPPESRKHAVIAEVFLVQGGERRSVLRAVLAPPGGGAWRELRSTLPAAPVPRELEFVTRLEGPAGSSLPGPEVAWGLPRVTRTVPRRRPDVLLLTVDTFRSDALAHAPGLRAILEEGLLLPRAVAPSNWTLPAYASLFTGLPATAHGAGRGPFAVAATGRREERGFRALRPEAETLASAFGKAGYATAMFHQNPFLEPWTGLDRGFERYVRIRDDPEAGLEAARAWWESEADRPRFLVLHCMAPHLPYEPDPARVPGLPPDPLARLDWRGFLAEDHTPAERRAFFDLPGPEREAVRRRYYGEIAALDAVVAPWLRSLLAAEPPPIVAFHSDHGEELWDEGSFEHGHAFGDAVIRVPVAVVSPGRLAPARREEAVAAQRLGGTLLQLAGVPGPGAQAPGLAVAPAGARCAAPLYRAGQGAVVVAPDGARRAEPFDPRSGAEGFEPVSLSADIARALAELGYLGDR